MTHSFRDRTADCSLEGPFYHVPGTADELIGYLESLGSERPALPLIGKATLSYLRGRTDEAYRYAALAEKTKEPSFSDKLSIQILMGICAMYRGDVNAWTEARKKLDSIQCGSEFEEEIVQMWVGGVDSHLQISENFPDWLRRGKLDAVPHEIMPYAQMLYAKYHLCRYMNAMWKGAGEKPGLNKETITIPQICEPIITYLAREGAVVTEMRVRLMCAVGYYLNGEREEAAHHINKAVELASPDRLCAPLAEYRMLLGMLFDDRVKAIDEDLLDPVKRLSVELAESWSKIHNYVAKRSVPADLSMQEREVARLAGYGFTNEEISKRLFVSLNTVRTHLMHVFEKPGISKRSELKDYII